MPAAKAKPVKSKPQSTPIAALPTGYEMKVVGHLNQNAKPHPVRVMASGGTVVLDGLTDVAEAEAYDAKGRRLGLFPGRWSAEGAAKMGYLNEFQDEASELSAWVLWNDAVRSGTRPLQDAERRQIIKVTDNVFLRLTRDKGWTVEWLNEGQVDQNYRGDRDLLELTYADEPFKPL